MSPAANEGLIRWRSRIAHQRFEDDGQHGGEGHREDDLAHRAQRDGDDDRRHDEPRRSTTPRCRAWEPGSDAPDGQRPSVLRRPSVRHGLRCCGSSASSVVLVMGTSASCGGVGSRGLRAAVRSRSCSGTRREDRARCAGGGSDALAPAVNVLGSPPRMSVPSRPVSSAKTTPAHAPIRTQIAAPENQVTKARAMPKTPNCAALSSPPWASRSSPTPRTRPWRCW